MMYMRVAPNFHYVLDAQIPVSGVPRDMTAAESWEALQNKFGKPDSAYVWGLFESLVAEP